MAVSEVLLSQAVAVIASVRGAWMDAGTLADDVILLAYVWPDDDEFKQAVSSVRRALTLLVSNHVEGAELKYGLAGWRSYHFQHHRCQGARADMSIIYRRVPEGIQIKGFGNRHLPSDIYERLARLGA
ncbi:hypothetical protein Uis1B_1515 [Bifidobacterium margollesii]|uniref:Uncharacterized protein n=1 Tax=Bifidobacterium margollesii TaxID=2020964 RepID=A0A2N5J8Z7_9BIFI|nr:hypothetical protein [Bifidobacterium margollesii]PLS30688.1 hypothetical protein Uis1B_1515 [Bifidobacterium margollesii]